MKLASLAIGLALATTLAGCDAGDAGDADEPEATPAPAQTPETPAPTPTADPGAELPDTTAEAVWAYLQGTPYQEEWRMWPGTQALYEGTEPHGMLLTTYLNATALDALTGSTGPLPDGSMVVKENYMPDSTLAAITVMYAVDGYDPEANDWFWAKFQPDGSVDAAGRVESCQECHSAGERGYLRTAYEGDGGGG
jgi:hypothetical protein